MKSRFFAATNIPSSPSPSQDGAEHLNLHGDSRSQLASWNAAFPLSDFEPKDLTIPPELEVPLAAIERADQFPPFFLLGRRIDSSPSSQSSQMLYPSRFLPRSWLAISNSSPLEEPPSLAPT